MKKLFLSLSAVIIAGGMFAQQGPTISNNNTKSTITHDEIIQLGQQHENSGRNSVIVIDFEGMGNSDYVNDFYNGGTSSMGYSGINYGIQFGVALSLIDTDAGGTGNFANEPSPSSIMFFLDENQAFMNVAAGFTTGFSFYYSSNTSNGSVSVYDGLNGTGNLLASINLALNYNANNCTGDPFGAYCNWDPIGVSFAGTARSVVFAGAADFIGFDDITFGSETPGPQPTPVSDWALFIGIALILTFAIIRFRRMI